MKFSTYFLLLSTILPITFPLTGYSKVQKGKTASPVHQSELNPRMKAKQNVSSTTTNEFLKQEKSIANKSSPQEETAEPYIVDRNAIFKGVDRKILANRIASWKLQTMPYNDLIKLQHALIVLVPFFQNNTSVMNFHQTKSRSDVTVQDVKNYLINLLSSTGKKSGVKNPIQLKIAEKFKKSTGSVTFHDDMLGHKAANKIKIDPNVLKNIKTLETIKSMLQDAPISMLQNENLETKNAKNVLELLNIRLRFLEDAVNEIVRKRYDPARSVVLDENTKLKADGQKNYNYYDMDSEKIIKAKERLTKREKRAEIMAEYKELKEKKIQLERKKANLKSQKDKKPINNQINIITGRIDKLREEMNKNKSEMLNNPSSTTHKTQKTHTETSSSKLQGKNSKESQPLPHNFP